MDSISVIKYATESLDIQQSPAYPVVIYFENESINIVKQ